MTDKDGRLTKRNPDGSVGINNFRCYNYQDFQIMASKLADYEDVGTIEELKYLKTENAELHCEIQAINALIDERDKEVRANAIDEFVNLVNECSGYTENCIEHDLSLTVYTIHQIAEELRGDVDEYNE